MPQAPPPTPPTPPASSPVPPSAPAPAKSFPIVQLLIALVIGAVLVIGYRRMAGPGGLFGDEKGSKPPPPPSETLPNAPGPDNTITSGPAHPGVPEQPPSPIESQTDLSKKPKENK